MAGAAERARRKELRRALGLVPEAMPWLPITPRYAYRYRVAHACFTCRKSFKCAFDSTSPRPVDCPQCGQQMAWMGRNFRAPRKDDIRQWKKVELLREAGVVFHGASERMFMPSTLREVGPFLTRLNESRIRQFQQAQKDGRK